MKSPQVFDNPSKKGGFITNVTIVSLQGKSFRKYKKCDQKGDSKDSHYYLHCQATQGKAECSFETSFKKAITTEHMCVFEQKNQTLEQCLASTKKKAHVFSEDSDIALALAKFIVKTGLSFSAACCDEFYFLVHLIISKTMDVNQPFTPENIFPRQTEKHIRKTIHSAAETHR